MTRHNDGYRKGKTGRLSFEQFMVWDEPCHALHGNDRKANPIPPPGETDRHVVTGATLDELGEELLHKPVTYSDIDEIIGAIEGLGFDLEGPSPPATPTSAPCWRVPGTARSPPRCEGPPASTRWARSTRSTARSAR